MFIKALHYVQVVYQVQLENGVVVMVVLYLVYAEPSNPCCQTDILPQQRSQADMHDGYHWHLVTRSGSRFTLYDLCHSDCMLLLHMHPRICPKLEDLSMHQGNNEPNLNPRT